MSNSKYLDNIYLETYKTLKGSKFNELCENEKLIKLTSKTEIHNGFEFKTGLNVDVNKLVCYGECKKGGIYFTTLYDFYMWVKYSVRECVQYREVTIPDDANVYIETYKCKADKLILSEPRDFNTLTELWTDERYHIGKNTLTRCHLQYNVEYLFSKQFDFPHEMYLLHIKQHPELIQKLDHSKLNDVDFRKKLYSVNAESMAYLHNYRTIDEIAFALLCNSDTFNYLHISEMCNPIIYTIALSQDPMQLRKYDKQTEEICMYAFSQSSRCFPYIKYMNDDMIKQALKYDGKYIQYIPNEKFTDDNIALAVEQNSNVLYELAYQIVCENVKDNTSIMITNNNGNTIFKIYDKFLIENINDKLPYAIKYAVDNKCENLLTEDILIKSISKSITNYGDIPEKLRTNTVIKHLFNKNIEIGWEYYYGYEPENSVILNQLRRNSTKKNNSLIALIPITYHYGPELVEYIVKNHIEYKYKITKYIPKEMHKEIVQNDIFESLFSIGDISFMENISAITPTGI